MRSTQQSLWRITISMGVVQFRSAETALEFVARADRCRYAAKRFGRNRVVTEHDMNSMNELGTNLLDPIGCELSETPVQAVAA